jgi:hypothetical protein
MTYEQLHAAVALVQRQQVIMPHALARWPREIRHG